MRTTLAGEFFDLGLFQMCRGLLGARYLTSDMSGPLDHPWSLSIGMGSSWPSKIPEAYLH